MRMRRAQHRGVGGAGTLTHVVGEAPMPGEQRRVLDALHRAPDEAVSRMDRVSGSWHAIGGSEGRFMKMVAGNGSGDGPGNDGASLALAPVHAAYSFADPERAVVFSYRLRFRAGLR